MNYLVEIVGVLQPSERRLVERGLLSKSTSGRRLELFKLILHDRLISDGIASQKLYGTEPNSAFCHLKARLFENILELLFPLPLVQHQDHAESKRNVCGRNILLARFLVAREAFQGSSLVISESLALAREACLLPEIMILEELQLMARAHLVDENEGDATSVFAPWIHRLQAHFEAKHGAISLANMAERENVLPRNIPHHLHSIAQQSDAFQSQPSTNAHYWQLRFMLQYHLAKRQIEAAQPYADHLLAMALASEADIAKGERLQAQLECAKLSYRKGFEAIARQQLDGVLEATHPSSSYALQGLEQLFLMDFYAQDYAAAARSLHIAIAHPKLHLSKYTTGKWKFYHANLEFVQGNWHQSLQLLSANKEFFKYKSKWLLGIKLVEIYNFIALGERELVDYKLIALKQLLKRQKDQDIDRCKYICRTLARHASTAQGGETIAAPIPKDAKQQWVPFNYEVLRVETWLAGFVVRAQVQA